MAEVTPILELKDLKKEYKSDLLKKNQLALAGVSCRFMKGQCTGLLGHNGAGKTTAIRMVFGLMKPSAGQILFDGKPIDTAARSHLGYMPEISKLPMNLTPKEILTFHLHAYRPAWLKDKNLKEVVANQLKKVGLYDSQSKKIKSLSKGMARRLAWAQATIHDPELIVLDEPFSGLDPLARQDLLTWIKEFKDAGKSLLMCTHELWTAQTLCDEVHIFRKGKLAYSTLDESEEAYAAGLTHSYYNLSVSGADPETLAALRQNKQLPEWKSLDKEGYLCRLNFHEYQNALAWLQACISEGYIIVKFSDELTIADRELRRIFEGGQLL